MDLQEAGYVKNHDDRCMYTLPSKNGKKSIPIQTEEDKCADSLKVDAGQNHPKINGAKKSKHGRFYTILKQFCKGS